MLLKVQWSNRPTSHYSPIENVQKTVSELYEDPCNYGVTVTVTNEDGEYVEFNYSERASKRGIREKLLELQNLMW